MMSLLLQYHGNIDTTFISAMKGLVERCDVLALSVWAAWRRAWGAGASAACRCGCRWRGSRGRASAARCASGSGASGWTPPCRTTCSATGRRSPPRPRTCCGTSTVGSACARALQPNRVGLPNVAIARPDTPNSSLLSFC